MMRILFLCLDAVVASVFLIPLFYHLNRKCYRNSKKAACYFLFAFYLSAVYEVVGLPDITYVRFAPHFNWQPFAYMFSDYRSSLLNVLLFLPMGLILPVFWVDFRPFHRTVFFGLFTSVLIEALQIFTLRATDVNDLMTNTLGTILGWCLGQGLLKCFPRLVSSGHSEEIFEVYWGTFAVMFFLQPVLMKTLFYLFLQ